jgi:HAD superfamily hydrolase (TIGR01459 family)
MTINLDKTGLKSLINEIDLLFIDIWGVLHNGIKLNKESIKALDKLEQYKKEYILLTNAPRPNNTVITFLRRMGLDYKKCEKVSTSGEIALKYLKSKYKGLKFFHVGPPRDFDLFKNFEEFKVNNLNECDFIICTGLFDEFTENLIYYEDLLKNKTKKKMVCTNPDLVVDRGSKREFCAGSVAKLFEDLGGEVEYFGKPYPLIYTQSANIENKKILCIGDNLNTDIKGANIQNFKSLFITSGIHKNENKIAELKKKYDVNIDYTQKNLAW